MIDPVALRIGPLAVHWYGISYLVGLGVGILILMKLNQKRPAFKNNDQIVDFAFWMFLLGVLLGGRVGYILFYNLPYYLENPSHIIRVWEGGMSFHGGLIGSLLVAMAYFKKHKISFFKAADIVVIPGALALTFTRLANFVNRELVGRPIENPSHEWLGVNFGDGMLRYPSQLFQSAEALLLFAVLLFIFIRKPKTGVLFFSYFVFNGAFRVFSEFFREPDPQVGYLLFHLTMGQILSLAVMFAGILGIAHVRTKTS